MLPDEVTCFWANRYAYATSKISLETFLGNTLDHVFAGTRHPEDERLDEADIVDWSNRGDAVIAAIKICMIQQDFAPPLGWPPSPERVEQLLIFQFLPEIPESLVQMLLQCKSETLDGLRALDYQGGGSILETPLLHQILVAMALQQGNRDLVKEMIKVAPPGPRCDLLFGVECDSSIHLKFRTRSALSHAVFKDQVDNGCDVWSALIRAGWAVPRPYMHGWATSSTNMEAGIELLKTLQERGIPIDVQAVNSVLWTGGDLAMLDHVLQMYIPDNGDPLSPALGGSEGHELLKAAAKSKEGTEILQILWKHRVTDINWLPKIIPSSKSDPRHLTELMMNHELQRQTPLHCAASVGNAAAVEWLILKGARPELDNQGRNQYDVAKSWKRDDSIHIFEKYGWKPSEKGK